MKICGFLKPDFIFLNAPLADKNAVLQFVSKMGAEKGIVADSAGFLKGLQEREGIMSTGIGEGIALPHAISREVTDAAVFLIRLDHAIDFDALDHRPVDVVLALVIPGNQRTLHLRILAGISRLCKNQSVMHSIRSAEDAESLYETLSAIEGEMAFH